MASFIVEEMVRGIHELIRGNNFHVLVEIRENLETKQLENRALYGSPDKSSQNNSHWLDMLFYQMQSYFHLFRKSDYLILLLPYVSCFL